MGPRDDRASHDSLVKQTFQSPEHAASLLRTAMPAELSERIDWTTLEQVPSELVGDWFDRRLGDVLFRARFEGSRRYVYIDVMLEHQSESRHFMVLRMLSMVTRRYEQLLRNEPSLERLPIVFPVVLFQGDGDGRSWRHATRLREVLDADPETIEAFAAYIPDFEFRLDDLTKQSIDELHERSLTALAYATVRLLRDARSNRRLLEELREPREMAIWLDIAKGPEGLVDLARFLLYLYRTVDVPRDEIRAFAHQLGSTGKEADMTAADRLIAEVAPRIRAEGKAEGRAEGRAEGKAEGRAEGRAEAAAALLRRLLTVKFGPLDAASEARIRAASIEELERWSERILVAETPSDVWGD